MIRSVGMSTMTDLAATSLCSSLEFSTLAGKMGPGLPHSNGLVQCRLPQARCTFPYAQLPRCNGRQTSGKARRCSVIEKSSQAPAFQFKGFVTRSLEARKPQCM